MGTVPDWIAAITGLIVLAITTVQLSLYFRDKRRERIRNAAPAHEERRAILEKIHELKKESEELRLHYEEKGDLGYMTRGDSIDQINFQKEELFRKLKPLEERVRTLDRIIQNQ